jgi:hypothetical protein
MMFKPHSVFGLKIHDCWFLLDRANAIAVSFGAMNSMSDEAIQCNSLETTARSCTIVSEEFRITLILNVITITLCVGLKSIQVDRR